MDHNDDDEPQSCEQFYNVILMPLVVDNAPLPREGIYVLMFHGDGQINDFLWRGGSRTPKWRCLSDKSRNLKKVMRQFSISRPIRARAISGFGARLGREV
eukprot:scaffold513_cov87-Skeletonema_dohrnii-CCMP3373.AAC.1